MVHQLQRIQQLIGEIHKLKYIKHLMIHKLKLTTKKNKKIIITKDIYLIK